MVASNNGWLGVDLDGTLADYTDGWKGADIIGDPVPEMKARVLRWLAEGREVRIFTARVWPITFLIHERTDLSTMHYYFGKDSSEQAVVSARAILAWSVKHFGFVIPITCVKDLRMVELYDDRCVQVVANTGQLVGSSSRGIPA